MADRAVSVSQLNRYISRVLATDPVLSSLCVTGEISGLKRHSSGHWYFDLKDVLEKAGASEEDLAALQEALDGCIVYKAATPRLLGTIDIRAFSGLTVYLPAFGTEFLDNYYKENVSWNDATSLVL